MQVALDCVFILSSTEKPQPRNPFIRPLRCKTFKHRGILTRRRDPKAKRLASECPDLPQTHALVFGTIQCFLYVLCQQS